MLDVEFYPVVGAQASQERRRTAPREEADLGLHLEVEGTLFDVNDSSQHEGETFSSEIWRREGLHIHSVSMMTRRREVRRRLCQKIPLGRESVKAA